MKLFRCVTCLFLFGLVLSSCDSAETGDEIPSIMWELVNSNLGTEDFGSVSVLDVAPGGGMFAARLNEILRSTDHGVTWTSQSSDVPPGWEGFSSPAAIGPGGTILVKLYGSGDATSFDGLARSTDGGQTLVDITPKWLGPENWLLGVSAIKFSPSERLFVCAEPTGGGWPEGAGLYRSSDYGNTWTDVSPPGQTGGCSASSLGLGPDGLVIIQWANKLFRSRDDGAHWDVLPGGPFLYAGAFKFQSESIIYAAGDTPTGQSGSFYSLYRSEDAGEHWTRLGLATPPEVTGDVGLTPDGTLLAFVSIQGGSPPTKAVGAYVSTDKGDTWHQVNEGLPKNAFGAVSLRGGRFLSDPDGFVYLFTSGLYRTTKPVR